MLILNRFAVDEEAAIVVEMERVGVPGRGRFCSGWGGLRGLVGSGWCRGRNGLGCGKGRLGGLRRRLLGLRLWLDGRSYASRAKGLTPEGVSYSFLGGTVWDGRVLRRGNGLSEGAARCGPKQLVGVAGEIHVVGDEWRK